MLETVEKMKKKGNFTKEDLAELGFTDHDMGDNENIPPVLEDENEDQAQDTIEDGPNNQS